MFSLKSPVSIPTSYPSAISSAYLLFDNALIGAVKMIFWFGLSMSAHNFETIVFPEPVGVDKIAFEFFNVSIADLVLYQTSISYLFSLGS